MSGSCIRVCGFGVDIPVLVRVSVPDVDVPAVGFSCVLGFDPISGVAFASLSFVCSILVSSGHVAVFLFSFPILCSFCCLAGVALFLFVFIA